MKTKETINLMTFHTCSLIKSGQWNYHYSSVSSCSLMLLISNHNWSNLCLKKTRKEENMVCIAKKDPNLYGFHLEGTVPNITTLTIKCNSKNHLCNVYIKVILIYFTNTIHSLSFNCTKHLFFTGLLAVSIYI